MAHWNVFAGYDDPLGLRGDQRFASTNWIRVMVDHALAGGRLSFRAMLSTEPLTGIGARGSVAFVGSVLEPFYGSTAPLGGMVFVRLRPGADADRVLGARVLDMRR